MDLWVCLWYQIRSSQGPPSSEIPLISLTRRNTICLWCPLWISIWIQVCIYILYQKLETKELEKWIYKQMSVKIGPSNTLAWQEDDDLTTFESPLRKGSVLHTKRGECLLFSSTGASLSHAFPDLSRKVSVIFICQFGSFGTVGEGTTTLLYVEEKWFLLKWVFVHRKLLRRN